MHYFASWFSIGSIVDLWWNRMKLGPIVTCPRAGPLHQAKSGQELTEGGNSVGHFRLSKLLCRNARRTTNSAALCQPGLIKRPFTLGVIWVLWVLAKQSKDCESLRKTIFGCSETNNITYWPEFQVFSLAKNRTCQSLGWSSLYDEAWRY